MDVTFLIGNGFDLNLGLRTKYSDFLNHYLKVDAYDETIKIFKKNIQQDKDFWSYAEKAFGEYTKNFQIGEVDKYSKCHIDFCKQLALYLKEEENRIDFNNSKINVSQVFASSVNNYLEGLRFERQSFVNQSLNKYPGGVNFSFINYNYTLTLDNILNGNSIKNYIGKRAFNGCLNNIKDYIHVHGTTSLDMILGVNDETQIANMLLFVNEPDYYLNEIIKVNANRQNENSIDKKAQRILEASDLIYIYGMSLGETDKLWWSRIINILHKYNDRHVIIYDFDAPTDELIRTDFIQEEEKIRNRMIEVSGYSGGDANNFKSRIHITNFNIFRGLSNLVQKTINGNVA